MNTETIAGHLAFALCASSIGDLGGRHFRLGSRSERFCTTDGRNLFRRSSRQSSAASPPRFVFTVSAKRLKNVDPLRFAVDWTSKVGVGSYGSVYGGTMDAEDSTQEKSAIVVKKVHVDPLAKYFGDIELYVNIKLRKRSAMKNVARFLGSYQDSASRCLVFEREGDFTLEQILRRSDWVFNLDKRLLPNLHEQPATDFERTQRVVKTCMYHIIAGLKEVHECGIVHRDLKPSNVIVSDDNRLKLIDFGSAVEVSSKLNFSDKVIVGDPLYIPPEEVVNTFFPYAFDMYATGVVFMQLLFPFLREEENLRRLSAQLRQNNFSVDSWLDEYSENKKDQLEIGLAILDDNGRSGRNLLNRLMAGNAPLRIGAGSASRHRFLWNVGDPAKFLGLF